VIAAGLLLVLVSMVLALSRALIGPTLFDRILAVNAAGTCTVLVIALHGFFAGRPEFLDLALVYALMNFIGTIAVLKYLHAPTLADESGMPHEELLGDEGRPL
jgi:multicomponent Na+:H+ antiporter subunit F